MAPWILPTLGYILTLGLAGVTIKLALRTISWQQLVLWVPVVYIVWAIVFAVFGGARFPLGAGGGWAALTAICASSALILFFVALDRGDASKVVPVGSAYPVVTLIASAIFLSESITPIRVVGTALVVAGVVLLSR
ncbi:MAG TPA: EamA family transporter [Gaiellaceae bacterium]